LLDQGIEMPPQLGAENGIPQQDDQFYIQFKGMTGEIGAGDQDQLLVRQGAL
jgi:hypothetical protein